MFLKTALIRKLKHVRIVKAVMSAFNAAFSQPSHY